MKFSQFITEHTTAIISEWEQFADLNLLSARGMNLEQRRDHVAGMLKAIVLDIETPQTAREQAEKSQGKGDAHVDSETASNAHGVDRAATGYTAAEMVSEFRALRASVLRLWTVTQTDFNRSNLEEVCRFNESIDQALAESMARYAQEVSNAKDLFLGVLGHDLRNPIGAIMMSTSIMIRNEGPDWRYATTASRILRSCTRMNGIVNDLLDFTRTRLGAGIPVVRAAMDMDGVCRQTVDEIAAFHPGRAIQFEASGELFGQWDRARVAQVLSNLVGNAHQHGSADLPLEVVVRGEPEAVVLTVHNKGPIIPKSDLQSIFSPFHRGGGASATSNEHSVGLGLYIVKAIVDAHHGTIAVESGANGTTFTVRLPRAESPQLA